MRTELMGCAESTIWERREWADPLELPVATEPIRHIAIAAGGSAGHVSAGLAFAEAYRERFDGVSAIFIGTRGSIEERLLLAAGEPFHAIAGAPFAAEPVVEKSRALLHLSIGILQARRLLARQETRIAVGFGGYASVGALLAARSLGLPVAIHESNVVAGLANRWLARSADRVYLGARNAPAWAPEATAVVTGNPVRPKILEQVRKTPPGRRARDAATRILILGGMRGSPFLNTNTPELLGKVAELGIDLEVRHQCGAQNPRPIERSYAERRVAATVTPFIEDMAEAYAWTDFAVSCSGALTLAELGASGIPSLLVPAADAARDRQTMNARASGRWWTSEQDWSAPELAMRIAAKVRDRSALARASRRLWEGPHRDSARAIVADCERLMSGRWVRRRADA